MGANGLEACIKNFEKEVGDSWVDIEHFEGRWSLPVRWRIQKRLRS